MKTKVQIGLGLVALVFILSYTWIHTSSMLAAYVDPPIFGYLAAAGIELSIVALSMRIGDLRKSGLSVGLFILTLVAVVVVSALANASEGFAVKFGEMLTTAGMQRLDGVQVIVSIAATVLLSAVTFALSELIGTDIDAAVKRAARNARTGQAAVSKDMPGFTPDVSSTVVVDVQPSPIEQARSVKAERDAATKAAALDTLAEHLNSHPDAPVADLSRLVGRSRTTVYSYLDELAAAGRIHRNGHDADQPAQ